MPSETKEAPTVTIDPHPQCSYIDAIHGARCVRRDDSHLEHWIPVMQGDAEPTPPLTLPTDRTFTEWWSRAGRFEFSSQESAARTAWSAAQEVTGKVVTEEMIAIRLRQVIGQRNWTMTDERNAYVSYARIAHALYEALKGE